MATAYGVTSRTHHFFADSSHIGEDGTSPYPVLDCYNDLCFSQLPPTSTEVQQTPVGSVWAHRDRSQESHRHLSQREVLW